MIFFYFLIMYTATS